MVVEYWWWWWNIGGGIQVVVVLAQKVRSGVSEVHVVQFPSSLIVQRAVGASERVGGLELARTHLANQYQCTQSPPTHTRTHNLHTHTHTYSVSSNTCRHTHTHTHPTQTLLQPILSHSVATEQHFIGRPNSAQQQHTMIPFTVTGKQSTREKG